MIKRAVSAIAIAAVLGLSLSGCIWLFLGAGAAVGYAVSGDTIAGELDADYDTVWIAAENVAKIMGTVKNKDRTRGIIELDVDRSKVNIVIERLTLESLRLKVSARKLLNSMPHKSLAQKIFVKINQQVKE